ncbi:MAG: AAA family ATPase [Planctomycetaceae bacterium]|jgi:predicted ATPase|nr:AAA family ATPase [Planctomycetaceae bacterium]
MKYIRGISIKNYRVLRDVSLGSVTPSPKPPDDTQLPFHTGDPLTPLTVVIGRNGYGKSTLCDAFGFIGDCLRSNTEHACTLRGCFDDVVSAGQNKQENRKLEFQILYDNILYTLCIAADKYHVPYVYAETLSHINSSFNNSSSMNFFASCGEGKVVRADSNSNSNSSLNSNSNSDSESVSDIKLADPRRLVLSTLGNLNQFPDIVKFRQFLDNWYLSYFKPDAARSTPLSGSQRHLNSNGNNLANVIQYWENEHKERLDTLLDNILKPVLGITQIETKPTEDGRLLLRFFESGNNRPFYAPQMSDGTLKLVAYMLLLGDPDPLPFICFEEPENGLYHKLLGTFIDEIRKHCIQNNGSQFFITTHQPYLVDALKPEEVWILEKGNDGFAAVRRASEDTIVRNMVAEGIPLGALWFSEYLDTFDTNN